MSNFKCCKWLNIMYIGDWCDMYLSILTSFKAWFVVIVTDAKCNALLFCFFKARLSRNVHTHAQEGGLHNFFFKHKTVNLQSVTVAFWVGDRDVGSVVAHEFANTGFHHTDGECLQEPVPVKVVTLLCFL